MKKRYIAVVVGLASVVSMSAQAEGMINGGERYGALSLGIQSVTDSDSGMVLIATVGQEMATVAPGFAVELESSLTIVSPSYRDSYWGRTWDADIFTLAGYGVHKVPAGPVMVYGRAGLLYESISFSDGGDETDMGLSFGAGVSYDLGNGISARADWTLIEADVTHLSVGASYNF